MPDFIATSIDREVGDGTTSAVILAGALLTEAEDLIDRNVHPTVIVEGFKAASQKAAEIFELTATTSEPDNRELLEKIASTSMASKIVSANAQELSSIVVNAILLVTEKSGDSSKLDIDNIKIVKKAGGSISDTQLIQGIVLDKEVVHDSMLRKMEQARIILLNTPLEMKKSNFDAQINLNSPEQMKQLLDEENRLLEGVISKIIASGGNVVLCQKEISDIARHHLANAGILALERIKERDMSWLFKATGAKIITHMEELTSSNLGHANLVEELEVEGSSNPILVEDCENCKTVSILIRGGSEQVVDGDIYPRCHYDGQRCY